MTSSVVRKNKGSTLHTMDQVAYPGSRYSAPNTVHFAIYLLPTSVDIGR
jgi:hypothetical protein